MSEVLFTTVSSKPYAPAAGKRKIYAKADGIYEQDSAGIEYLLGSYVSGSWYSDVANTWSYSSADAPTFIISINADMTSILCPGMRIKLTQTTEKYFIVTAVGAYSGGATLVTVYGGTDYTLTAAAITYPYYSNVKAPLGFSLDPSKWTVETSDTTDTDQAAPGTNTWYNVVSGLNISIPIGLWRVYYSLALRGSMLTSTAVRARVTLSTANNSESDADMTAYVGIGGASGTLVNVVTVSREKIYSLAAKATYYPNVSLNTASGELVGFRGSLSKSIVRAECVYL